jgi:hypothetical protein
MPFATEPAPLIEPARPPRTPETVAPGREVGLVSPNNAVPETTVRINSLSETANTTTRALLIVDTAEQGLAEINALLLELRELLLDALNRGEADPLGAQGSINRTALRIDFIVETTRFAGISLLDGGLADEPFAIDNELLGLTVPSLRANRLGTGILNSTGFTDLARINLLALPNEDDQFLLDDSLLIADPFRLFDPLRFSNAIIVVNVAIDDVGRVQSDLRAFREQVIEAASRALDLHEEIRSEPADLAVSRIRDRAAEATRAIANGRTGIALDLTA